VTNSKTDFFKTDNALDNPVVCAVIGCIISVVGIIGILGPMEFSKHALHGDAVITETAKFGPFHPSVEWKSQDGEQHCFAKANFQPCQPGEHYDLLYDKGKPGDATINTIPGLYGFPLFDIFISMMFFAYAAYRAGVVKKERAGFQAD
jgi:hypothetical protein